MNKKIISVFVVICLLISMFNLSVFAEDSVYTYSIGSPTLSSVTATFNATTGVLTISGTGATKSYGTTSSAATPLKSHLTSITEIVVEEGVTSLGDYLFYYSATYCLKNVVKVTLPSTLESIGAYNFTGTPALLTFINNATSAQTIGNNAFYRAGSSSTAMTVDMYSTNTTFESAISKARLTPTIVYLDGGVVEGTVATSGTMNSGISWSYDIDTKTLSFTAPSADAGMFLDLEDAPWTAAIQAYGIDAYYIGEGIAFIEYGVIDGEFSGNITAYMALSDSLSSYCPNANITYLDLDTSSYYVPEDTPADYQSSLTVSFTINESEGYYYLNSGKFMAPANTTFVEFFKGYNVIEYNDFVFISPGIDDLIFKLKNTSDNVYVSSTDYIEDGKVYYAEYYGYENTDIYDVRAAFTENSNKYGLGLTDDWYYISVNDSGYYIPAGYTWADWVNSHYYHSDFTVDTAYDVISSDGKIIIDSNYLVPATDDNLYEFSDVADHEHPDTVIKNSNVYGIFDTINFQIQTASALEEYTVEVGTTWDTWVASIQNRNSYAINIASEVEDSYGSLVVDNSSSVMSSSAIRATTYSIARTSVETPTINFTIDGSVYTAEEGQSFAEWIASDYNTLGLVAGDSNIITSDGSSVLTLEGSNVVSSAVISEGDAYTLIKSDSDVGTDSGDGFTGDTTDDTDANEDEAMIIVNAEPTNFLVTVPIVINISMTADGIITTGNGYVVENECAMGPVIITNIEVIAETKWTLTDWNADYANMKASSKNIGLTINGVEVSADGSVVMNDSLSSVIKNKESKTLSFGAKLAAQRSAIQENVAAIVFIVDFDKV